MRRGGRPVEEPDEEDYDEYEGGEEGGYYGSHGDTTADGHVADDDAHYEDGEEGVQQRTTKAKPAAAHGRRALTESEEEDRRAEEELEDEEEAKDSGLTYEEFLAKKKPSKVLETLKSNLAAPRQWYEGNHQVPSHKGGSYSDDERPPLFAMFGGSEHGLFNELWYYYPQTDEWKRKSFLGKEPSARQSHSMVFVPSQSPEHPSRLYVISGATNQGKENLVHFLSFGAREDEGVWGYEHIACTNVQEAINNDFATVYNSGISKAVWCGCPEFENATAAPLYRKHWQSFFCRFPEEWKPVSGHSAVVLPGGAHAISGHVFSVTPPILVSYFRQNFQVKTKSALVLIKTAEATQAVISLNDNLANAPSPRFAHVALYIQSKGMYVIGGNDGKKDLNDAWLLPYAATAWERIYYKGVLPPLSAAAAASVEHYIFIFGGKSNEHTLGNLFVFNTKDNSVREVEVPGSAPCPRIGHSMVFLGHSMYIYGGKDANGQTLGDFIELENVTEFSTRASLLGADFLKELNDSKFPDIEITSIDGKSIKAHRSILAARNQFFRRLFMTNEQLSSYKATHPFETEEILRRFLAFLYSDTVSLSAAQAPLLRQLALETSAPQLVAICNNMERRVPIPPSKMQEDMRWLLDSGFLSDVELIAGHRTFKAHKNILAARSPFFRAMFASKFKEATGTRAEMNDLEPEMLEAIVHFIYFESLDPKAHQLAFELLAQSDLLELPDLKDRCANALADDNAALLYDTAELYHVDSLAEAAFRYVWTATRATAGMDDTLIKSLSTALFVRVNAERAKHGMPALVARTDTQWTWNDACPKCKLPLAYSSQNSAAWAGKLPKDILAEVCGAKDLRYERVLSLQNQVGHRAKDSAVTLPNGKHISPPLSRNTRRDAEQTAAAAAIHVYRCSLNLASIQP